MRTEDFNYLLPNDLIAQQPLPNRGESRLFVLNRGTRGTRHDRFTDLPQNLSPGDLVIVNNSKVIPARLRGTRSGTGGRAEVLLVEEIAKNHWWAMIRPGKRLKIGSLVEINDNGGVKTAISAEIVGKNEEGHALVGFHGTDQIKTELDRVGQLPLPPYIERQGGTTREDMVRYQTVYAGPEGSVAAPTAGLHFTPKTLEAIQEAGARVAEVTLHVGLGTFAPVKAERLEEHIMHRENYHVSEETAEAIARTKAAGKRVIAVGTTSLRVLESAALEGGRVKAGAGSTQLFVYPPYTFKVVDGLVTNFHLPQSTLLVLVSAFAAPGRMEGREMILNAYAEAVRERYRFFSYGDAMLLL